MDVSAIFLGWLAEGWGWGSMLHLVLMHPAGLVTRRGGVIEVCQGQARKRVRVGGRLWCGVLDRLVLKLDQAGRGRRTGSGRASWVEALMQIG